MYPHGFLREHSNILLWIMRFLDATVIVISCLVAYVPVFGLLPLPTHYQVAVLLSVLLLVVVFQAYALYRAWRGIDYAQEFTTLFLGWTTVFAILAFLSVVTKTSADYSRAWFLMWYVLGGASLLLMRYALRLSLQNLRSHGYNLRHIVIIASGDIGQHVTHSILEAPETGFNIVGYFTDDQQYPELPDSICLGPVDHAKDFSLTHHVDQIWLAVPLREADRIEKVINDLEQVTVDIRLVPDIFGFRLINHSVNTIAGMPVINLSVTPMDGINRWIKAGEDLVISSLTLLILSPVLVLIALVLKVTDPGPVFYKQKRLSWNGKSFVMYKFRTMPLDAEKKSGAVWSSRDDDRATPFGSILRSTSLDELPQFWNVLKGDMSIVGPRPEREVFVKRFKDEIPSYMRKHMVKAGITGWAQVNGWRGDTDLQKRIEHDLYYIDNWSLWLDLKIIFLTLFKGFGHKNAY